MVIGHVPASCLAGLMERTRTRHVRRTLSAERPALAGSLATNADAGPLKRFVRLLAATFGLAKALTARSTSVCQTQGRVPAVVDDKLIDVLADEQRGTARIAASEASAAVLAENLKRSSGVASYTSST